MDTPAKPWWQSKAMIGAFVAMGAGIFQIQDQAFAEEATTSIYGIVTLAAGLVAAIGRVLAEKKLV